MEPILDLVKSYLTDASKGEAEISPKLVREFKKACGDALKKQFSPDKKKWRMRMSGLGKPLCQQQLDKKELPRDLEYNAVMRFLMGDLIEAAAIFIMKASGVNVEHTQKKVSAKIGGKNIKGTLDIKINGKVWDIKSSSPYAFTNKFGNYGGYSKIKEDDPFGYLVQGYSYSEADDSPFGGWIAVNKSTGEWAICEAPQEQEEEKNETLQKASDNVKALVEDKPFKKLFEPKDEKIKIKGEDIFTKNKLMPMACSFCSYKYHCWPNAELHKKVATRAQNRPMVWYTKLVQKDLENCL
jgi:hypothetical protein